MRSRLECDYARRSKILLTFRWLPANLLIVAGDLFGRNRGQKSKQPLLAAAWACDEIGLRFEG